MNSIFKNTSLASTDMCHAVVADDIARDIFGCILINWLNQK